MATKAAATKNLYQRLHACMADCKRVGKDGKVQGGGNYKFVSHDAITTEVREHLIEHGVLALPTLKAHEINGNRIEAVYTVRFVNIDDPSDFYEIDALGFGIDSQDKGPGKAASYAVKYALSKALCLPTGDDPENDSISHKPKSKQNPNPATGSAQDRPASAALNNPPSIEERPSPEAPKSTSGKAPTRDEIIAKVKEVQLDPVKVGEFIREKYYAIKVDALNAAQRRELFAQIATGSLPDTQAA